MPYPSVGFDRIDAQAIESLSMTIEKRQEKPLPRLLSPQKRPQPLRLNERPARLGERLAEDPLCVRPDPRARRRIVLHGPGQLVQRKRLQILAVTQRMADHLGRYSVQKRDQDVSEVGDQGIAHVVERLGLNPGLGLGVLEEGVEVGLEQLHKLLVAQLFQPGFDQLVVLSLPAGHRLLLGPAPAVGGQLHRLFRPAGTAQLPVRERGQDLRDDGVIELCRLLLLGALLAFCRLFHPHAGIVARGPILISAGQAVSEAAFTMVAMDAVIDLAQWRSSREAREPLGEAVDEQVDLARLERAVERVHELVGAATDHGGHLVPSVETELLAILGELTIDLVGEAAARAERLAARLASR